MENPTEPVVIMSPELIEHLGEWSKPTRLRVNKIGSERYELEAGVNIRYRIRQDDDGHWYVVRDGANDDFEAYVESEGQLPFPNGVWAIRGWPGRVTFTDPKIDGEDLQ